MPHDDQSDVHSIPLHLQRRQQSDTRTRVDERAERIMTVHSAAPREEADRLLEDFERCWRSAETSSFPDIAEFAAKSDHVAVIAQLICLDMEYRWSLDSEPDQEFPGSLPRRPSTSHYLDTLGLSVDDDTLFDLLMVELRIRELATDSSTPDMEELFQANRSRIDVNLEQKIRLTVKGGDLSPGDTVGRYRIVQKINEGGMGAVYRAMQQEPIRREVALKVVRGGMASEDVLARFEAERQALALMDHPNIAHIFDAGTTQANQPFFVMELVHGVPITEYCDSESLSVHQRLRLLISVCHAVQHAHQKGVIHRDLKPSNVLVTVHDGEPVPKVIDFGLAKATQHQIHLTDRKRHTEFGRVVGTLQYMSPEQAEMNQLDVDTRTDVYSLGVILYELLTGTTPLERKSLVENALLAVLTMIRDDESPAPSARLSTSDSVAEVSRTRQTVPKKLMRMLRTDLDAVVMAALEKDRDKRYATANDLANDLQCVIDGTLPSRRNPGLVAGAMKLVRRHRALATSVAAVVAGLMALLLIGIVSTFVMWRETVDAGDPAKNDEYQAFRIRHAKETRTADSEIDEENVLSGKTVNAVAVSSTGQLARSTSAEVRIYRSGGSPQHTINMPHVVSLAFSPDGQTLFGITAECDDRTLYRWNLVERGDTELTSCASVPLSFDAEFLSFCEKRNELFVAGEDRVEARAVDLSLRAERVYRPTEVGP